MNDHDKQNLIPHIFVSGVEQQYRSQYIDMSIQYITEVVVPDVSTSQSIRVPI